MTINLSDNNPRANYTATSGQTAFTIPFDYFDDGDISVYQNGTLKTITTHYTISGSTVTLVTGATAGDKIAITRDVPLERTTDLTSTYNAASINNQLDTIVAQIADLDDRVSRSISLNDYEVGVSLDLPATADRLGKTIQFNSSTGALEVGPSGDELTSIASIASEITALDGISSNITSVAGYLTEINNVGDNIASVTSVSGSISSVGTVATNIADVNSVAGSITDLNDVADSLDQVELVATSISNVDIVGPAIANVNTVAGDITNINTLANSTSNIALVAAALSNINTTVTNLANINLVGNNIDDVNDVANVITKVTTVADNIANVNTVAPEAQYLSDVANNISVISTVGQNISDVQSAVAAAANAAISESNAATSETNAATSASNASTSASNAAASASSASSAQTSAESARDATLAAFDSFDDRYLGAKAADPSVDNDGNALVGGALYYNSTDEVMKVYTGSQWVAAYASLSGALLVSNNLSDLNNAASARTNLGLGTAATTASTDYATAAQGALADTAVQPNDSPTFAGLTTTADVSFGDNDKAIFGAGSDLQIYHDGTHSYISDTGTGALFLQGNGFVTLEDQATGNNMAQGVSGGTFRIHYDGSEKLATTSTGIDVTGTVTADGLSVDDGEILLDSSAQAFLKLDRGSASSHYALTRYYTGGTEEWRTGTYNDATSDFHVGTSSGKYLSLTSGGDISFYEDTGATPKFFWDASAESLGIGTSSPAKNLHLYASSNAASVRLENTASNKVWDISPSIPGVANTGISIHNVTDNRTDLHIDNSGNVGIGVTPVVKLDVQSSSGIIGRIQSTSGDAQFNIAVPNVNDGILAFGDASAYRASIKANTSDALTFQTGSSLTERIRIDSSGKVGIGTSSPSADLHIVDDVTTLSLESSSSNGQKWNILSTYTNTGGSYGAFIIEDEAGSDWLRFDEGNGSPFSQFLVNGSERMRIKSDGNLQINGQLHFTDTGSLIARPTTNALSFNTNGSERMRITAGGALNLGTTGLPTSGNAGVSLQPAGNVHCGVAGTSATDVMRFDNPNGRIGSITVTGTTTSYNTSSDYRLKENVTDVTDGITRVKQLAPKRFNFIVDPDKTVDGFIAHEAQAVVPEAVTGTHDALDVEGNPEYQGIDQSKLVPLLTAALQEAIAKIETLETKVAALEGA